jgi:hypothetical protein
MLATVKWLEHAFAVDPPGPAQPDPAQRLLVDKVCGEVVRRRLSAPALLVLEMSRPLNYLSAQVLQFFHPFLTVLVDAAGYEQFTSFLERRGSIDYLVERIEAIETEHRATHGAAEPA